jgi:hypothetical protein
VLANSIDIALFLGKKSGAAMAVLAAALPTPLLYNYYWLKTVKIVND